MNTIARTFRSSALAAVLAAAGGGCALTRVAAPVAEAFPIDEYTHYRRETNRRVSEIITELAPRMRTGSREERVRAMKEIAAFVREHVGPHPEQAETLYTYADRLAGPRYTETMRYQHDEIGSQVGFLEKLAAAPEPDVEMFRAKLNSLAHYMRAHMDTETYTIAALVVDNELERQRQVEKDRMAAKGGGR